MKVNGVVIAAIFFSENLISTFRNFDSICYDGTFYIVPKQFNQLFIVSVKKGDRYLPTFFILMKNRLSSHYQVVFEKISILVPTFHPNHAIGDFEAASIKALRQQFPEIVNQGCFFHFKQANLRKIGELGLKSYYLKNKVANQWFNVIFAIGFLPNYRIHNFYDTLAHFTHTSKSHQLKSEQYLAYFERMWLRDLGFIN